MGEARRRGTQQQREGEAIKRNKRAFAESLGVMDEDDPIRQALKAGLKPFMDRMTPEEWQTRRARILDALRNRPEITELAKAQSVRVRDDEMGWYLFLCEQAIEDPMCNDVSQSQRILPFFAGIGTRWQHAHRVAGIDRKLDELLKDYRKDPDGLLFELLVALSYAAEDWNVTFIQENRQVKTPDMRVVRGNREFFVECKRMSRSTQYSERERNQFLRLWDAAKTVLMKNGQWIWFKGTFHIDPAELPDDYLRNLWERSLPIGHGEQLLLDNEEATIRARLIDCNNIHHHLRKYLVKAHSPMLAQVLGGNWVADDDSVTYLHKSATGHVAGCEASVLGSYVEEVAFACGFTRDFDSQTSIDKKAKDITKLLADAVNQVPIDKPSIIHLAAETMEGTAVERQRSEKVKASISTFILGKPVVLVRFHRLHAHQRATMLYEMDETVDHFVMEKMDLSNVPSAVAVPPGTVSLPGSHWDLYP